MTKPAPELASCDVVPPCLALMYTIDGWIALNAVWPGGGTLLAAAMPLSTSELTVLEICTGVSVDGRSLARATAITPRTTARPIPSPANHGLIGRRVAGGC